MPTLVAYTTGPQEQALATLRFRAAAQALNWEIITGKEGVNTIFPDRVNQADAVLIQRDFPRFFPAYRQILETARQAGKPLIYDLDDLLIALPDNHPNGRDYEDALGGIFYTILIADQVVVSTPLLHEILLPIQPQTIVWPTVLPDTLWTLKSPRPLQPKTPLKIGYMGGSSHLPDVALLIDPLRQVLETLAQPVELHFWGCQPPNELKQHAPAFHHPGIAEYSKFAAAFSADAQADIWLAPLQPGLFNRCKSAIKFWEYSAVGGVGVYSDIDPYRSVINHGENGFLATTEADWVTAVTQLAINPDLRFRMAQNAQHQLKTDGLLSAHLQTWQHIYTTPPSTTSESSPSPSLIQAMIRFSEQIQQRSDERHLEVVQLYQRLYDIYESRWWRAWQRFKKIVRLDFSPLPHYQPFGSLDTDNQPPQNETDP